MNSRIWGRLGLAASLVIALAGSGCGGGEASEVNAGGGSGSGRSGGRGRGLPSIVPVETVAVERGDIARSVTVAGVVEPIRTVAVNSQVAGQLRSVTVEEGMSVRQGDPMATLDDRELRAQLDAAQAEFDVAEAAYQRAEQLRDRQVITLPEYERDRTAYTAAEARLAQLKTRIDYTVVNAPVTGIVTEKRVEAGDAVGVQTNLFTLADVSTLVVRVGVSELDVVELKVGDEARVVLDALPGSGFQGRIRRVFPSADPGTRLVTVEVALPGADARTVRPGFLARVTFPLDARRDVLLLPAAAIVSGAGSDAVYVVENNTAVRRSVATGLTSEGRVEIASGLTEGETVVVAGNNNLRDGMEVRPVGGDEVGAQVERGGGDE